jgi:hypothetical protein
LWLLYYYIYGNKTSLYILPVARLLHENEAPGGQGNTHRLWQWSSLDFVRFNWCTRYAPNAICISANNYLEQYVNMGIGNYLEHS